MNCITGAVGGYGMLDVQYDKAGNRLSYMENGFTAVYSYVPDTNRIGEIIYNYEDDPVVFEYDGNGNTTAKGGRTFEYGQDNRLATVSEDGVSIAHYAYNGLGRRVMKTIDGEATHFIYDVDGRLIAEMTAGSDAGTEYLYKGKGLLAQVDMETDIIYTYHTNYLGAVHQLTDETGTIIWEAVYKTFGEAVVAAGSPITNNWRLPGQYFDEETGLYYNYHRYYDPGIGRYLTPDPIGLEGGINLYAYVKNNPINLIDPQGLNSLAVQYYIQFTIASPQSQANCEDLRRAGNDLAELHKKATIFYLAIKGVIPLTVALKMAKGGDNSASNNNPDGQNTGGDDPNDPKNIKTQWGWRNSKSWRQAAREVDQGGTIEKIGDKVPTRQEAIDFIQSQGGKIQRIEAGHQAPNPHQYSHINYTTSNGLKGTIQIQGL